MSVVPIFSEGYSRAKLFIDYFSWPCELFKTAHACALRDCLGVSRPFVSDTSPKCIDREGLKRRCTGTSQYTGYVWFWSWNLRNIAFYRVNSSMTANNFHWLILNNAEGEEGLQKSIHPCHTFLSLRWLPLRLLFFPYFPHSPKKCLITRSDSSSYLFYWLTVKQEHECCFPVGWTLCHVKSMSSHKVFLKKKRILKSQKQNE